MRSEGAISGQIKDEHGNPIAGARVEITGPLQTVVTSDASGLFALPDAAEGTYRLRVAAGEYFQQLVEIEVRARETSMPQIILLRAPTHP
jgi:5-hydroxyisourate hydrolase-like protein (transthyretin family)